MTTGDAMLIGYARVSTDDQNLDLQRDALRAAGRSQRIYEDRMSGAKAARPGLAQAMEMARAKDVLTVWRLDRLGRSLHDLIVLARTLDDAGIGLMSLQATDASDTVLFSAAYTKQGGTNHINEQPHTYWARLFAAQGFVPFDLFRPVFWGNEDVCFWYRQNVFLYLRKNSTAWQRMETYGFKEIADTSFMNCIHPDLYNPKAAQADSVLGFKDHLAALLPSLMRAVRRRFAASSDLPLK